MIYEEGTISHGTLRSEDLIPRFMEWLPADHPLRREHDTEAVHAYDCDPETGDAYDQMEAEELVIELIDALDELAPEGMYFGTLEGDGSDYGFWRTPGCP